MYLKKREKTLDALERVRLKDNVHQRPNQLSSVKIMELIKDIAKDKLGSLR